MERWKAGVEKWKSGQLEGILREFCVEKWKKWKPGQSEGKGMSFFGRKVKSERV